MILNSFIFYIFFCSAVLIYGIGINRQTEASASGSNMILNAIKTYSCVVITVVITFLISKALLIPIGLAELFPLVSLLIFLSFSVFIEILINITAGRSVAEYAVSFLTILLSLNEGLTLVESIMISLGCLTSFYLLIPVLSAMLNRVETVRNLEELQKKTIVFFCMIVIMIALYSLNISWLNPGVIK